MSDTEPGAVKKFLADNEGISTADSELTDFARAHDAEDARLLVKMDEAATLLEEGAQRVESLRAARNKWFLQACGLQLRVQAQDAVLRQARDALREIPCQKRGQWCQSAERLIARQQNDPASRLCSRCAALAAIDGLAGAEVRE